MTWIQHKLVRKISVFFILLTLFILGTNSYLMNQSSTGFFIEESEKMLLRDAAVLQQEIDGYLQEYLMLVDTMSKNEDFLLLLERIEDRYAKREDPLYRRVTRQLQGLKSLDSRISLVFLGLAQANDLITDRYDYDSPADFDLRNRFWYQETIDADSTVITSPYIDFVTGEMIISVAKAIWKHGEDIGAVAIDVKIDDLYQLMEDYDIGISGYPVLVTHQGEVIYHPSQPVLTQPGQFSLKDHFPFHNDFLTEPKGVFHFHKNQDAWYAAHISLKSADWTLMTFLPESEVLAPLGMLHQHWLTLLLGFSALALALILLISRQMTRPLSIITHEIRTYEHEKIMMAFPTPFFERTDEIGSLVHSLYEMSHTISQYTEELQAQNEELIEESQQRKATQDRLELILELLSGSQEATFITTRQDTYLYANDPLLTLINKTPESLASHALLQDTFQLDVKNLPKLVKGNTFHKEITLRPPQEEPQVFDLTLQYVQLGKELYYLGYLHNITKEKKQEHEILQLKTIDPLTDLLTGVSFENQAKKILTEHPFSLHAFVLLNIRRFRLINEARGHHFGNQILIRIATMLKKFVSQDDLVSRFTGDEFGVLLTNLRGKEAIYQQVKALGALLNSAYAIDEEEVYIEIAMGVSVYPSDGDTYRKILSGATSALNQSKKQKLENIQYYNELYNQQSIYQYELQKSLRNAIEAGEFSLVYQPQVHMKTKEIIGIEALCRWNSPKGPIPPDVFISLAEDSGLIVPLGEWILQTSCQFAASLEKNNLALPVSVNVSALQFTYPYLVQLVEKTLQETKLSPDLLELELTEGILMHRESQSVQLLKALSGIGVKISIDDFGTGYSSLSYLNKFQVDKIKIDRSFIQGIPNKDDGTIAKVIIELAHSFELEVIAEGVESSLQASFLLEKDCCFAQGYYYYKPLLASDLQNVLTRDS